MRVQSVHTRDVAAPAGAVFAELVALGTPADRIWPSRRMPFVRTPGELVVGKTRERHGFIRAELDTFEPGRRLIWRAHQPFIEGTHGFTVTPLPRGGCRVEHALEAVVPWWFAPIWRLRIAAIHDRLVPSLLKRLAAACARA
jgi:hypothetical protein